MPTNQILASDKILRMNNFSLLGMVQSEDWAPNLNAQDIFELGRTVKLDTAMELEVTGTLELQGIGGLPGLLARCTIARDSSGNFTGYVYNAGGAPNGTLVSGSGGLNGYSFNQDALDEMEFDLLIHERTDSVNFDRTTVLPRCFVSTISGRADANGIASETINFTGDFAIGLPGLSGQSGTKYHDARSIPCTVGTGADAGKAIMIDTGFGSTNYTLLYAYINEQRIRTVADNGVSASLGSESNAKITFTGISAQPGDVCRAIVYKTTNPATTFPAINDATERGTTAYYIRGFQVNIYLKPANTALPQVAERWLRVQSVDWSIDRRLEVLKQLAFNLLGTSTYVRVSTLPYTLSLNASVLESDWSDWKAFLVKTFPGNDKYQDSYDLAPANLNMSFTVTIRYYTKAGALLQDLQFMDLRVEGRGQRTAVGGRGEVTWNLRGTKFNLNGSNN